MPSQYILNASAHSIPLPAGVFHCCVTSPPYYSLRKYAGQQQVDWPAVSYAPMPGLPQIDIPGCDPDCEHTWGSELKSSAGSGGAGPLSQKQTTNPGAYHKGKMGQYCQRCGGWRGALGLEPTPEAYIGHLVACFREIRRVLRDDGVCWVVMGDSYSNSATSPRSSNAGLTGRHDLNPDQRLSADQVGMKPGDLMLIPHRLALALQADGWLLRNDCVWAKVAPMPESVAGWRWQRCRVKIVPQPSRYPAEKDGQACGDVISAPRAIYKDCPGCPKCSPNGGYVLRRGSWRHTRAHEVVLMLTKKMGYYSNQESVRENRLDGTGTVVKHPNLLDQISHLSFDNGLPSSDTGSYQVCVGYATTLLDFVQLQTDFGLSPFDSEIWQELFKNLSGLASVDLPTIKRATAYASGFLDRQTTTKTFSEQLNGLGIDLSNRDFLPVSQRAPLPARSAGSDGDASITINNASEISQDSFIHDTPPTPDYTTQASLLSNPASGRNPRSVLTPRPESYGKAHYAVFPSTLIAPLIRASCPTRCCPVCGAGWAPVVERTDEINQSMKGTRFDTGKAAVIGLGRVQKGNRYTTNVINHRPACDCAGHHIWTKKLGRDKGRGSKVGCERCRLIWYIREPEPQPRCYIPGTVLDPFVGSGTTLRVARELGLNAVGLDISGEYLDEHAKPRIGQTPSGALETLPLFGGMT